MTHEPSYDDDAEKVADESCRYQHGIERYARYGIIAVEVRLDVGAGVVILKYHRSLGRLCPVR